jgi:hypothetical protein
LVGGSRETGVGPASPASDPQQTLRLPDQLAPGQTEGLVETPRQEQRLEFLRIGSHPRHEVGEILVGRLLPGTQDPRERLALKMPHPVQPAA